VKWAYILLGLILLWMVIYRFIIRGALVDIIISQNGGKAIMFFNLIQRGGPRFRLTSEAILLANLERVYKACWVFLIVVVLFLLLSYF